MMRNADKSSGLGLLVAVDGSTRRVQLYVDDTGSCATTVRQAIGCRQFAAVDVESDLDAWVDDDLPIDLDDPTEVRRVLNRVASLMVAGIRGADTVLPILGPALFTGQRGGETLGLAEAAVQRLEHHAALCTVAVIRAGK